MCFPPFSFVHISRREHESTSETVSGMASPKKSKKSSSRTRHAWTFLAGIALPVCLAAGWHAAYGQQEPAQPPAKREATQLPAKLEPSQPAPKHAALFTTASLPQEALSAPAAPAISPQEELAEMRQQFSKSVHKNTVDRLEQLKKQWSKSPKLLQVLEERRQRLLSLGQSYYDFIRKDVAQQLAKSGRDFVESQYFVFVDRNPSVQFVTVGFYDAGRKQIDFLGTDLISSGNIEKGGDYFETPTGVFENLVDNFSYRALGTPNQDGWRGLGAKDSRVWDFGDQKGYKKYKNGNTVSQMRLLMHSTDPDKGEPRLGRIDSKGCVRISHGLNGFLDTYAILDRNYELWIKTKPDSWLLRKDRKPVSYPGKFLIIGDSSLLLQAQAKP